jgi:hypothetical protein
LGTSPSLTPILDFQKPLPLPLEKRVTGVAATPFLFLIGAIAVSENNAAFVIPFGIVLALFLSTVVHELGHLAAGRAVGMRFKGVLIGPFAVQHSRTRWQFRLTRFWVRGFAYMSVPKIRNIRRRLIVYVLGGPVSSLICGISALIAGEVLRARSETIAVGVLELFGAYSVLIGIISFRRFRVGQYAGDGMLLQALVRSRIDAKSLVTLYGLDMLNKKDPDGVNWNDRWSKVAFGGHLIPQYYRDKASYNEATDPSLAANLLEKRLAASAFLSPAERDLLIAEVVRFVAWHRSDETSARRWLEQIGCIENVNLLIRSRMNAALETAAGHRDVALRHWQAGLDLIRKSPTSPTVERYELRWLGWKQEILERLGSKTSATTTPLEVLTDVIA